MWSQLYRIIVWNPEETNLQKLVYSEPSGPREPAPKDPRHSLVRGQRLPDTPPPRKKLQTCVSHRTPTCRTQSTRHNSRATATRIFTSSVGPCIRGSNPRFDMITDVV